MVDEATQEVRTEAGAPVAAAKSRRHSQSEKAEKLAQIERRLKEGSTLKAAAEEAGISDHPFYQWKRAAAPSTMKATAPAPRGDSLAELVELEADNLRLRGLLSEKLRAENAALRRKLEIG
jgi:putative transposase